MNPEDLALLASQSYTRVPVTREVLADLETPVSTYLKLARGPNSYLLESVHGGEKWGRYSIIGMPSREVIKVYGHDVRRFVDGELVATERVGDPLAWIDRFKAGFRTPDLPGLPPFAGGLVGYFGYDTVRYVEKRLAASCPPDELQTPDILLLVSEDLLVFDTLRGSIIMITHVDPGAPGALAAANERLDRMAAALPAPAPALPALDLYREPTVQESDFVSGFTRARFEAAVETIKQYVLAGDVMQVVPSQRLTIPFRAEPINLYRALRRLNPSPYMYFLDLGDFQIVGSSPEILARLEHGLVTVRPIAGTRRRGHDEAEDLAFEQEMVSDPKEIAEHLMLIDLGRNDIGRVAVTGSVQVTEHMKVERYSHVMHIVSEVTGRLRDGLGAIDVLRATHPAGTLSGAPKIRAMEIIDELEPVKRGVYGGAVGYLSWSGNMDTAIAIRTAVIKNGVLNIQAGAGIVADSQPALEWKETMNKARAMFRAVAMVTGDGEGA